MILYNTGRQHNFYATLTWCKSFYEDKFRRGQEVVLYYYKVLHIIFCFMYNFITTFSVLRLAFLHI